VLCVFAAALMSGLSVVGAITPVKLNGPLVEGGYVSSYRFSPDASRVVYLAVEDEADSQELYSVPAEGGRSVMLSPTLPSGEFIDWFEVSPDSLWVVYIAYDNWTGTGKPALFRVPVGGGMISRLSETVETSVSWAKISPDGTRVAYLADQETTGVYELYSVPISGGASVKLSGSLGSGDYVDTVNLAFSPDGSRVVYGIYRQADNGTELYSVPAAGGSSVRLSNPASSDHNVSDFGISPDSSWVVYRIGRININFGIDYELYSVPILGGVAPVRLNQGASIEAYQISPDSSRVVYRRRIGDIMTGEHSRLYSVLIGGGSRVLLCTVTSYDSYHKSSVSQFGIAPDSSQVFYLSDQDTQEARELYRVPLAGGEQHRLNPALPGGRSILKFVISPDGSQILYLGAQVSKGIYELFAVSSSGGTSFRIGEPLLEGQLISDDFQYLADGSRIFYRVRLDEGGSDFGLFATPNDGNGPVVRIDAGSGPLGDFLLAPDSSRVVYRTDRETQGSDEIYARPLQSVWQSAGGRWDAAANWDVGLPDGVTAAIIDTPASVSVPAGSTPQRVCSLVLGGAASGDSVLQLTGGATLRMPGGLDLRSGGILGGDGTLSTGAAALAIPAGAELACGDGERLHIASGPVSNEGLIDAVGFAAPVEIRFSAPVANGADTGYIAAHNAALRFEAGVDNLGSIGVTGDSTQIFGAIDNGVTGQVIVTGGATAIFQDDVSNAGVVRVGATGNLTSTAVFFGAFSGNGVSGGGNVFLEGDTRPGFSPGLMSFGGDVSLGPQSSLEIQIAGTAPGTGYDRIEVAGALELGGALRVSFIDGVVSQAGDVFDVWDAGSVSGAFSSVSLPALSAGLFWQTGRLNTEGVLSVALVPESWGEFASAYALTQGPDGDDDADGISNLVEYLQGLDPTVPDFGFSSLSLVHTAAGDDELTFLLASPGGADLRLELQTSIDMAAWTPLAVRSPDGAWSGPLPVTLEAAGPGRVRAVAIRPGDAARRFYRILVKIDSP